MRRKKKQTSFTLHLIPLPEAATVNVFLCHSGNFIYIYIYMYIKGLPLGAGSVAGWGAQIPRVPWPKNQNIKLKQYGNKFTRV